MNSLVSIIILNWNGLHYTKPCIEAIRKNTSYKPYEIIVVDNGSKQNEIQILQKMQKQRLIDKLIENKGNKGFAGANNQGIEAASGDYFFLLNNDTLPAKGWLDALVKVAESSSKIGIVGPHLPASFEDKTYFGGGFIDDSGRARHSYSSKQSEHEQVGGAAFFIKKKVFEKIGFFDEKFFPIYFEESDYCNRARRSGFRVVFTPESKIIHFGSALTSKQPSKWLFIALNKNRLRYMLIHFSAGRIAKAFFWEILRFAKNLPSRRAFWLLQAYWQNAKNLREIMRKRKSYSKGNLHIAAGEKN